VIFERARPSTWKVRSSMDKSTLRRRRRYSPSIELLEDRRLLSFAGSFTGQYSGQDSLGDTIPISAVDFTVDGGGNIAVTVPGSGSGTVTTSGSATIGGVGGIGSVGIANYSFTGSFVVSPSGVVVAGGQWTATVAGVAAGNGNWAATDQPGVFVVVNTSPGGAGSLFQAGLDANSYPTPATILFSVGSGPQTLAVNNPTSGDFPIIGNSVTIDGTSQPGYAGQPLITLEGPIASNINSGSTYILTLTGNNSVVRGVNIEGGGGYGIVLRGTGCKFINNTTVDGQLGGIDAVGPGDIIANNVCSDAMIVGSGCTVTGNTVGADYYVTFGGNQPTKGSFGLEIGSNDTIGGTTPGARNVLAGLDVGGSSNVIEGNFIGTDATGTSPVYGSSLGGNGVEITGNNNTLTGNLISGNGPGAVYFINVTTPQGGVLISGSGNVLQGNLIGTDITGTKALANAGQGVYITGSSNTIGGTSPGDANVIAFNTKQGVDVASGTNNAVLGNSIFANGSIGIDLGNSGAATLNGSKGHTGPNNYQNFPVITSIGASGSGSVVVGTLNSTPNANFRIEFFDTPTGDPSGYGQGNAFIGFTNVTTNGSGAASFSAPVSMNIPLGQGVTATATDPNNNTSEFSAWFQVKVSPAYFQFPAGFPLSGVVGTFVGANANATVGEFSSTVNWGDGTTSSGTVTQPGGAGSAFDVSGSHTYAAAGTFAITVTAHDSAANSNTTINSQAVIHKPYLNDLFMAQVYLDLLGRNIDPAGLSFWVNALDQGSLTRGQVVAQLTASQEYQDDVVNNLFQSILHRPADATGLSAFTSLLASGGTTEEVEAQLFGSGEFFQDGGNSNVGFLNNLYKDVLNRSIDASGLQYWEQALENGMPTSAVAAQIIASREAQTDLVQSLYQEFLHRPADGAGLNYFVQTMQQGAPGLQVIIGLVGSAEFTQDAGGDANQAYVAQLYVSLLHRQADSGSLTNFTNALDSGTLTRQAVVQAILDSQEYRGDEVQMLYQRYLHRAADPGGLSAFTALLNQGDTDEQVASILLGSGEYFTDHGALPSSFLSALYLDALRRPIDPSGLNYWEQALANGATRAQVATAIFASREYQQDVVQGFYKVYLNRSADPSGLTTFANMLASGGRDETVIAQLAESAEFFTEA